LAHRILLLGESSFTSSWLLVFNPPGNNSGFAKRWLERKRLALFNALLNVPPGITRAQIRNPAEAGSGIHLQKPTIAKFGGV
jgi:hypothetical protein